MRNPNTAPLLQRPNFWKRAVPLGTLVIAGATAPLWGPDVYHSQDRDWGCATAPVENGGTALEAARAAAGAEGLGLPFSDATVSPTLQGATETAVAAAGSEAVQPVSKVTVCAQSNPLNLFDRWDISASVR